MSMIEKLLHYYYANGGATKVKRIALSEIDWNEAFNEMKERGVDYADAEATKEGYESFLFKGIPVILDEASAVSV